MQVDLQVSGLQRRLAEAVEIAVYRSIQEGLRNVVCHAGVKEATIRLWLDGDMLRIEVEDRGKGFDLTSVPRSTGLNAVRERMALVGGSLTVETAPGEGTRLMAAVPVQWAETGLATEIDAGSQDR
jgi:signal transduction histidine kinase